MAYKFLTKETDLKKIEKKVYQKGFVDREHLVEFLETIPTSNGQVIVKEVKAWLHRLHDDPKLDKVRFPEGDIDAILGDLDSYGRVSPETILKLKENSNRTLPIR